MGNFQKISSIIKLDPIINPILVETGTYLGESIKSALLAGYTHIHSIEIDPNLYFNASYRFRRNENVHIHYGDSSTLVGHIIDFINLIYPGVPVVFWLDAHFPGSDKSQINYWDGKQQYPHNTWMPLLQELLYIVRHRPHIDTIIIDDLRCFSDCYHVQSNLLIEHLGLIGQSLPQGTTRSSLVGVSDKDIEEILLPHYNPSYFMEDEGYIVYTPH